MKRLLAIMIAALWCTPSQAQVYGHTTFNPKSIYWSGGGIPLGGTAARVCVQAADDATPSMNGSTPNGCNILLTATDHTGANTITNLDDVLSGIDAIGTYEQRILIIGRVDASGDQTTIADVGNFILKTISWDSPATGVHPVSDDYSVLELKTVYMTAAVASVADGGGGTSLDVTSNAHGMVAGQSVTLSAMSVAAYDGTYTINSVAANTFNVTATYSATATGTWASTRFDEISRSGNVDDYFYQHIYVNEGNATDFTNAQVVVGHSDTGITTTSDRTGVVGEAAADGSDNGYGISGYGLTSSAKDGIGVFGGGFPDATGDTTVAYGMIATSSTTHAGGDNVGLLCQATGSSTDNHCLEVSAGHVVATLGTDFEIYSEETSTAAVTNSVGLYSGAATNAGDYDTGQVNVYSGATTTAGDSGNVALYSGAAGDSSGNALVFSGVSADAAEVSGNVAMYSGAQSSATGGSSGTAKLYTGTAAGTSATGEASFYTGAQTNVGDYDSGRMNVYTGASTTLGNTGPLYMYTGDAADESGLISIYTGDSANTVEASGGIGIATGNQTHATGGSSGSASVITGTAAGQAATGDLDFYTGNQTNVGDYASGSVDLYSGTSATLGDTGAVAIRSGNAADTSGAASLYSGTSANTGEASGAVSLYSGAQSHATGGVSGEVKAYSGAAAGTAATGNASLYTGDQTNAGDYDSGAVNIYSGISTTAGDTGAVSVKSGDAADASGSVTVESGISANTGESSGEVVVGSGNQTHVSGTNSGDLTLDTGTAAGTGGTGAVLLASGDQSNVGDYASGTMTIETGTSATLGDTGAVLIHSGNAADTSGAVSLYSGTSAAAAEVSGDVAVYSGAQSSATGGSSGTAKIYTGTAAGTSATGNVDVYSGNQTNAGDYDSGTFDAYTGTTVTLGDTGAVDIRSGNAADTSGEVDLHTGTSANTGEASGTVSIYSGDQGHASGGASGDLSIRTGGAIGAATTGSIISYTGAQTNTGDVPSGSYTWTTGATTTDGDSGSFTLTTGVAGAGAADAGSFIVQTHGANPRLTIDGAGTATFTGTVDHSDQNITSVGDIALDSITPDATDISVTIGAGTLGVGDGTYSWDHSPNVGIEGILEVDGVLYADGGATIAGLTMAGDLDLDWNDAIDIDEIYGQAPTSDTAPDDTDWLIANAYAKATGGSQTGASGNVRTGIGSRYVTFNDFANSAGDIWRGVIDGVGTPTYDLVADTDFTCSTAADDAECALNFKTDFNTQGWPATASCDDGTCTNGKVYLQPDDNGIFAFTHTVVDAGGGAMGVVTSGADGSWSVHTVHNALVVDGDGNTTVAGTMSASVGVIGAPGYILGTDTNTGWYSDADGTWRYSSNDTEVFALAGTGVFVNSGKFALSSGVSMDVASNTILTWNNDLAIGRSAAGKFLIGNALLTQALMVDASINDVVTLKTESETALTLKVMGDGILDAIGASVNSPALSLRGDDGGTEVEGTIQLAQGAQPYLFFSVDDDSATPVLTQVLHLDDVSIRPASAGGIALGSSTNYYTSTFSQQLNLMDTGNDHYLTIAWNEDNAANAQLRYVIGGDDDHTLTIDHDFTVEAASLINQDLTSDSTAAQFDDLTLTDDLLLADGAVIGITGNEVITFDAAGTVTVSGATLSVTGNNTKGALTTTFTKTESVTFNNDAAKTTVGEIFEGGIFLTHVTGRVTTALAGCTSVDVGDGVDVDIFIAGLAVAQNTTFDGDDVTASFSNPIISSTCAGGVCEITVTANGGNCTAGVIALTAHGFDATAATAN